GVLGVWHLKRGEYYRAESPSIVESPVFSVSWNPRCHIVDSSAPGSRAVRKFLAARSRFLAFVARKRCLAWALKAYHGFSTIRIVDFAAENRFRRLRSIALPQHCESTVRGSEAATLTVPEGEVVPNNSRAPRLRPSAL